MPLAEFLDDDEEEEYEEEEEAMEEVLVEDEEDALLAFLLFLRKRCWLPDVPGAASYSCTLDLFAFNSCPLVDSSTNSAVLS